MSNNPFDKVFAGFSFGNAAPKQEDGQKQSFNPFGSFGSPAANPIPVKETKVLEMKPEVQEEQAKQSEQPVVDPSESQVEQKKETPKTEEKVVEEVKEEPVEKTVEPEKQPEPQKKKRTRRSKAEMQALRAAQEKEKAETESESEEEQEEVPEDKDGKSKAKSKPKQEPEINEVISVGCKYDKVDFNIIKERIVPNAIDPTWDEQKQYIEDQLAKLRKFDSEIDEGTIRVMIPLYANFGMYVAPIKAEYDALLEILSNEKTGLINYQKAVNSTGNNEAARKTSGVNACRVYKLEGVKDPIDLFDYVNTVRYRAKYLAGVMQAIDIAKAAVINFLTILTKVEK